LFTIPWDKNRLTKNLPSQKSLNSILNVLIWQIFLDSMFTPWDSITSINGKGVISNIKNFEIRYNEEISTLNSQIEQLQEQIKEFQSKSIAQQEQITNLENQYAQTVQNLNENLSLMKAELDSNNQNLAEMENLKIKNGLNKSNLSVLEGERNMFKEKLANLENMYDQMIQNEINIQQEKKFQIKLENEINELKQQLNVSFRANQSTLHNESLNFKIDKQVEINIQNKLDTLIVERAKHIMDIENYKAEIVKLNAQYDLDKDKLIKENEKLSKEQQQHYHQKLKKQAVEIKQLNEKMKDQQDTNNFLTNQINNLNKQIFELENKENGENEMRSENRPHFVNKRLLEVSLMEDTNDDINSSKHLQSQDQNLAKALDLSSNQHTPAKPSSTKFINSQTTPSSTTSSSSMTPSTTKKKQEKCAQQ